MITKVEVTVEGSPNKLNAQNMAYRHHVEKESKKMLPLSKKIYICMISI